MTPELKAKWCAALRSGDYQQGRHTLHNLKDDTYCCLGVLTDICDDFGDKTFHCGTKRHLTKYGTVNTLSHKQCKKYGIQKDQTYLAQEKNDTGDDFHDIANWIEENL